VLRVSTSGCRFPVERQRTAPKGARGLRVAKAEAPARRARQGKRPPKPHRTAGSQRLPRPRTDRRPCAAADRGPGERSAGRSSRACSAQPASAARRPIGAPRRQLRRTAATWSSRVRPALATVPGRAQPVASRTPRRRQLGATRRRRSGAKRGATRKRVRPVAVASGAGRVSKHHGPRPDRPSAAPLSRGPGHNSGSDTRQQTYRNERWPVSVGPARRSSRSRRPGSRSRQRPAPASAVPRRRNKPRGGSPPMEAAQPARPRPRTAPGSVTDRHPAVTLDTAIPPGGVPAVTTPRRDHHRSTPSGARVADANRAPAGSSPTPVSWS